MNRPDCLCFFFLDHPINPLAGKFKVDIVGNPHREQIIAYVPDQAVDTPDGDHPVTFFEAAQEFLSLFLLLLLWPDQQEIKNYEKENQW